MIKKERRDEEIVLVGVLKNQRDRDILFREKWYRIPLSYAPKRQFHYLAFYQPLTFGKEGKQIQYFARVLNYQVVKRKNLLPAELNHPHAEDDYFLVRIGGIKKLDPPIKNIKPRRVSFGFATLTHFLQSKTILQLYRVPPIEEILEKALKKAGIAAVAQHHLSFAKKRFCLDFAIFCQKGNIAIECDNKKAHSSALQQKKDKIKDNILKRNGWHIVRLKESSILSNLRGCLLKIQKTIERCGGVI